ncbi:conserved hypothetical protein [Culex quinquefasciatus]|uniref:Uncharacterized protein n=1 Tax=Culex quinquefasciatus TaxID=7176 RepID=B0WMT3_CULQU|nr:conserved hypothetical protein [Culex quinquefasciatus]|eukprot:XP_001850017.1 conserved hypothetical protein [Culex quinquefasciatus]
MKVDKAVCTTDTYEDLNRAIRFEAVFSTLVENKILAIKRECELKKRNKKSRALRRILFGRRSCKKTVVGKNGEAGKRKSNGGVAVEEGGDGEEEESDGLGAVGGLPVPEYSTVSDGVDEVIVEIGDFSSLVDAIGGVGVEGRDRVEGLGVGPDDDSTTGPVGGMTFGDELPSKSEAKAQSLEDDRKSIRSNDVRFRDRCGTLEPVSVSIEIEPHSDPLSTQYDMEDSGTNVSIELDISEISEMKRSIASEPVPIIKNVSKYRMTSTRQPALLGTASHRLRVLEAKSISAQNSPVLPRQKSTEARHLTFSTATYQTTTAPSTKSKKDIEDTSFVIDLSRNAEDAALPEAGNLSNSNSNVIPKEKQPQPPDRRSSSKKQQQALVDSSSSSASKSKLNKLNAVKRFSDVLVYDNPPPPTPGLIESFNQLTAPNLPVISMRQSASPVSDMIKLHRLSTVASASATTPTEHPATTIGGGGAESSRKPPRHGFLRQSSCDVELHYRPSGSGGQQKHNTSRSHRDSFSSNRATTTTTTMGMALARDPGDCADDPLMMGELNESDEEKLNKRKYKYLKRCSDPVIVFPSTSTAGGSGGCTAGTSGGGGLQHCILSRPPNQPIQFPYDEDFMYDVSLQLDPDRHGELDAIVIDPDDLPKRARWTIIATAFLLLIMCLFLVGITLRMAPIIDDMGKSA